MRIYKLFDTVFNIKRDQRLFDDDPVLLQRSICAFQRVLPHAIRHRDRFHSQFGQDALIAEILMQGRPGTFLDVGARCGLVNSNSLALERHYGWKGLLVEPERENYASVLANRKQPSVHAAVSDHAGSLEFVSFSEERGHSRLRHLVAEGELSRRQHEIYTVDVLPISELLRRTQMPAVVDYADIDVEGEELQALKGIDFEATCFRVLAVESNAARHGAIRALMGERGYFPLCKLGVDVFYVPRDGFDECLECIGAPR